jgi:hypothetical protein
MLSLTQSPQTPTLVQNSPIHNSAPDPAPFRLTFVRPRQDGDFWAVRAVFSLELLCAVRLQNCLLIQNTNGALKIQHPALGVTFYGRELRRGIRDAVLRQLQHLEATQ